MVFVSKTNAIFLCKRLKKLLRNELLIITVLKRSLLTLKRYVNQSKHTKSEET